MSEETTRHKQIRRLINDYLIDLSDDDLYKLMEVLRRTDTFRKMRETPEKDRTNVKTDGSFPLNLPLAAEGNLVKGDPRYDQAMKDIESKKETTDIRTVLGLLNLNTAHYGVIVLPRAIDSGVIVADFLFGIQGIMDARVSINWHDRKVATISKVIGTSGSTVDFQSIKDFTVNGSMTTVCTDLHKLSVKYNTWSNRK